MHELFIWVILLSHMPCVDADDRGIRVAAQARLHVGGYRAVLLSRVAGSSPEWVRLRRRIVSGYSVPGWEPEQLPSIVHLAESEWTGTQYEFDTRQRLGRVAFLYYQQQLTHDMPWAKSIHYETGRYATYELIRDLRRAGVPETVVNAGVYTLRVKEMISGFCADHAGEGD